MVKGRTRKQARSLYELAQHVETDRSSARGRRITEPPDPNDRLIEQILTWSNMQTAWKPVRADKGAPGVENMAVDQFGAFARENRAKIRDSLLAGKYQLLPVKRVQIPKPTGGLRPLGIPTVVDRLIQQAVAQVLMPIFDPGFSDHSHGFRSNRSVHDAVRNVQQYIKEGYRWAVDMDLEKFFDTVNHDVLMHRVACRVRDKRVCKLIGKYLRAGVMVNGRLQSSNQGVPQGGPLLPLLANIVLDDLDKELERRGHCFVRYADDFLILVKSQTAGKRVMTSIKRFIERKLKLKVNETKIRVAKIDHTNFLGFTFKAGKIRWSEAAFKEFKRRVRKLPS